MKDDETLKRVLTDGGFGRKVGEYEDKTVLMGTEKKDDEFCVVVYWNNTETDEGVQIATVDNSHGQTVHVDKYRDDEKVKREDVGAEVSTVYGAEQYVKKNWHALSEFYFSK